MSGSEHVQTKELAQVKMEKEKLMKELVDISDEILALKQTVVKLQEKINSHVCVVVVPEDPKPYWEAHQSLDGSETLGKWVEEGTKRLRLC